MDALIALNRRELELGNSYDELSRNLRELQSELDKIRIEKAALLATLVKPTPAAKPAASTGLLTPTKVKSAAAAAPPPAPKKSTIVIRARRASGSTTGSVTSKSSAASQAAAPPSEDAVLKHWKAFKKAKHEQITAAANGWGKARVKTAIQNAYQLEHPANAAVLDQIQTAKQATKPAREPSEWLRYVAAVKEELGCSHKEAMKEAGARRRAAAEEA